MKNYHFNWHFTFPDFFQMVHLLKRWKCDKLGLESSFRHFEKIPAAVKTTNKKTPKLTRNATHKTSQIRIKTNVKFHESNIITCPLRKTPPPLVTPLLLRNHKTQNSRLLVSSKHHPIHQVDLHLKR